LLGRAAVNSGERLSRAFEPGDQGRQSFDAIYVLYERRIFNAIFRMIGNYDDAEDLMQETFVNGYRGIDRFRGDAAVYSWLYRIAMNVCKQRFRNERWASQLQVESLDEAVAGEEGAAQRELPDDSLNPYRIVESHELQAVVRRAIQELPREWQVPIVLREDRQLSYAEIAAIMEIPVNTVKTRIFRARGVLRRKLGAYCSP
jgi:RNA polymerase sigma-70 factor, ECF subfamily